MELKVSRDDSIRHEIDPALTSTSISNFFERFYECNLFVIFIGIKRNLIKYFLIKGTFKRRNNEQHLNKILINF